MMKRFKFNKTGDGISVGRDKAKQELFSADGVTVEVNCRMLKLSYDATLFSLIEDATPASIVLRLGFHKMTARPVFYIGTPDAHATASVVSDTPVPIATWVHLAGTYDGEFICLFVDGKCVASQRYSHSLSDNCKPPIIGHCKLLKNGGQFYGEILEFRTWLLARSKSEIAHWCDQQFAVVPQHG